MMDIMDQYAKLLSAYDKYMREQKFEPVPKRFDKYLNIVKFFVVLAKQQHGVLYKESIMPHSLDGYVTVRFNKLVLKGKTYQTFAKIVQASSAFEIVSRVDNSFEIALTFDNIFKVKH